MLAEQLEVRTQKLHSPQIASVMRLRESNFNDDKVWQRVLDEEMSLVAEGLRGHLDVPFDFAYYNGELQAADGENFCTIVTKGLAYAEQKFLADSRCHFLVDRAIYEQQEARLAEELAAGNLNCATIVTISAYPEEAERKYGKAFVQSLGFQPDRKLTLVRAVEKTPEGIRMHSRGIENSELKAWNKTLGLEHNIDTTENLLGVTVFRNEPAVAVLDDIEKNYKLTIGSVATEELDVWQFMQTQKPLIDYFIQQLTEISQSDLVGNELCTTINDLRYQFWSAMAKKLEAYKRSERYLPGESTDVIFTSAASSMRESNAVFAACGMSIGGQSQVGNSNTSSLQNMMLEIFGGVKKCVKCPYCKQNVDAKIDTDHHTIECLNKSCGAKVDTKTGKRIDKKTKSWFEIILGT